MKWGWRNLAWRPGPHPQKSVPQNPGVLQPVFIQRMVALAFFAFLSAFWIVCDVNTFFRLRDHETRSCVFDVQVEAIANIFH